MTKAKEKTIWLGFDPHQGGMKLGDLEYHGRLIYAGAQPTEAECIEAYERFTQEAQKSN